MAAWYDPDGSSCYPPHIDTDPVGRDADAAWQVGWLVFCFDPKTSIFG